MKLSYFSVSNFRSITSAYKIDIREKTVLLGKNNVGKTNILKALMLSMDILRNAKSISKRNIISRSLYDWQNDYPMHLQNTSTKESKYTYFRLDFELEQNETDQLYSICGSYIRKAISVLIKINENNEITIFCSKRGKNTKENLSVKLGDLCKFITDNIDVQFVPAIRVERDAISAISSLVEAEFSNSVNSETDAEYIKALEIIEKYQNKKLDDLSTRLKEQLSQFIPKLKKIKINLVNRYSRLYFRKDVDVEIDDGVQTNISQKGDGVKSLVTIALLSQVRTNKNRIIIVDEPENHLHPEAIHYIKNVLFGIPDNNQVIISTHSPIFVNRNDIKANIIVHDRKAEPANKIDDIRSILGTLTSDNLQYADYVIVVEGPTDRAVLHKYFKTYQPDIAQLIDTNKITIRSIGGVNNLFYEIAGFERACCKYLILLDNDTAGRDKKKETIDKFDINQDVFRFFTNSYYNDSELEDLYDENIYKEYLSTKSIDITNGKFKNRVKKWSDRIKDLAADVGILVDEDFIDTIKKDISEIAVSANKMFADDALKLLEAISNKVREDIKTMNL